jgi:hypothetical protein
MKLLYTLKYNPSLNSRSPIYNPMDLNITQSYIPLGTNKQKTQATNREYFKYSKKGYI